MVEAEPRQNERDKVHEKHGRVTCERNPLVRRHIEHIWKTYVQDGKKDCGNNQPDPYHPDNQPLSRIRLGRDASITKN
jgi:hypothetical protein